MWTKSGLELMEAKGLVFCQLSELWDQDFVWVTLKLYILFCLISVHVGWNTLVSTVHSSSPFFVHWQNIDKLFQNSKAPRKKKKRGVCRSWGEDWCEGAAICKQFNSWLIQCARWKHLMKEKDCPVILHRKHYAPGADNPYSQSL